MFRQLAAGLGITLAVTLSSTAVLAFTLEQVINDVESDYPQVQHLPSANLASTLNKTAPLLLDVREADEFAVSRIPGAVRVSPGISKSKFLKEFAAMAKGRQVIMYCSVGVRSSELAEDVQAELKASGAVSVHNLQGGIFRWHNQQRELIDQTGSTEYVHPYNRKWGQLIKHADKAKYRPAH